MMKNNCNSFTFAFLVAFISTQASVLSRNEPELGDIVERIVGGRTSTKHYHPWAVYFEIKHNLGPSGCTGSLIGKTWVLTIAQCFLTNMTILDTPYNLEKVIAYFGKHNLNQKETGEKCMKIPLENIIVHEDFSQQAGQQAQPYNIALIRLPEPIEYTDTIKPIGLPDDKEPISSFNTKPLTIIGWGIGKSGKQARKLKQGKSKIIDRKECKKTYSNVDQTMFCLKDKTMSTCMGDGGGSIEFERDNGKTILVGMSSFSKIEQDGTCLPGQITGAVYVPQFMDWISGKIKA